RHSHFTKADRARHVAEGVYVEHPRSRRRRLTAYAPSLHWNFEPHSVFCNEMHLPPRSAANVFMKDIVRPRNRDRSLVVKETGLRRNTDTGPQPLTSSLLGRDDRNDFERERINDYDLVLDEEVFEAAVLRNDPHDFARQRHKVHTSRHASP